MSEPVMKKVKGDGVEINLAVWEGTEKHILCLHGITANCRCWDVIAPVLSPKHRVLAMDLRGRGLSEKPGTGYSLEHHIRDMNCVMDGMGLQQAVIMGHSLGAFITLAFGAEHPERVDRLILVDGGGDLSEEQMDKVFEGIKPALDRLGKVFPSADAYLETMRQAPYIQPWSSATETYYRYEIEEVEGGVRSNINPAHIEEEAENVRKAKSASFYQRISCKVLVLRATEGLFSQDDLLLPEDVVQGMISEIPDARRVDIRGTNHYGIVFQPNEARDRAILDFLEE
ncbi:MAG: alpha/beta hydrolase [Desulfobacteraceae bacterium]|jgi:pimeloyl-ACP methyl ester carboxylesterase